MFPQKEAFKKKSAKKKTKDDQEKPSGRVILFLLLASTGLALIFYLSSFLPAFWKKITAPKIVKIDNSQNSLSPTRNLSPTPTPWQKNLEEEITSLVNKQNGLYGVYLYRIEKQDFLGVNNQEVFSAASLMKLPIAIAAYQEAEKKQLDLTAQYFLKEEDKLPGNGSVHLQPEGTVYTYRSLLKLALEQSDNTASVVIAKTIGEEKIQETIDRLGLTKTDYETKKTTPEDVGRLLLALYQEEVLTPAHRQEMIGFLTNSIFNDQIPAFLPDDLIIAHKIGLDENLLHDAAIIFTDKGDFVLVIMSQGDPRDQAQEVLKEITRKIREVIENSD